MKLKASIAICSLAMCPLGSTALPSRGQDLNAELDYAICNQNWDAAIEIIDRARTISPQSTAELEDYRDRLVELQNSRSRVPEWGEECTPPPLPAAISPSPSSGGLGTMVETLDHLKECKPYKYGGASIGFIEVAIEIGGWHQERCAMRYLYGDGSQLQCQLSRNGVDIMTNEKAYENARLLDEFRESGNLDSNDGVDNPGIDDIFNQECRYIDPPDN